jgi:crotonobetaine/carnitine-CoA ligase
VSALLDTVGRRTIGGLLDARADERPDDPFLVFEAADGAITELTYGELRDRVRACARGFADLGVESGDCVVVQLRNSPEILVAFFALAHLGAIFVPSNTGNTAPELSHVLAVSEARIAITEPAFLPVVEQACGDERTVVVARGSAPGRRSFADLEASVGEPPAAATDPLQTVELIFTSGTTSAPKGVMLTHENCLGSGLHSVHALWLEPGERCITALPLFHVNAQALSLFAALTVGGTLVLLEEFRASRFWEQLRRHRATQTAIVAMQLRVLLAQPAADTDRDHALRRVFYALNVSTPEKEEFERRFGVRLINGYGCSEAMTLIATAPVVGDARWPSVGLPAPGRVLRLIDEAGRDVAPGEVGEIVVRGDVGRTIMAGYYRDPDATAAAVRDGWLHTGDKAYADEDGFLFFFDRKKDMIKRAGENVSASEVEVALASHPEIDDVAVVGIPDPIRDEAVAAAVVLAAGSQLTAEGVIAYAAERLARFKVPTVVAFREGLPKTSVGKVRKAELRDELAADDPAGPEQSDRRRVPGVPIDR